MTASAENRPSRSRPRACSCAADAHGAHEAAPSADVGALADEVPSEDVAPSASADAADGESAASAASGAGASHFMYVLECVDGSLYTGYAVDVHRRLATHNAGRGAKYTRARRPVTLLAYAGFATKHDAMSAEYRFKQLSRDEKDALLARASRTSLEEALSSIL